MKFIIEKEIFEKFPELHVGVLVVKGLDNSGGNAEIMGLLKGEEERIRENFQTPTLSQNPKIEAWRKAYSSFGAKPKNYKCSVENLYRLIIEGINLRHINKLVDVYNYISIKHLVPVGGDDVEKIDGDIRLTIAKGDENFVELNSDEVKNPKEGEVVYRD
ncbi:MAG: B3/4 domain-containing protein, partial [Candidatus Nanoarchaeia archaeon]